MSRSTLRSLLQVETKKDTLGTVVDLAGNGAVLVRVAGRVDSCATMLPVSVGDEVRLQGALIIGKKASGTSIVPEYLV